MAITQEIVTRLKSEHPGAELHQLTNDYAEVVVRVPAPAEYYRFLEEQADPQRKAHAFQALVTSCTVYPPEDELRQLIQRRPGIVVSFGNDLLELGGLKAVTERKKL